LLIRDLLKYYQPRRVLDPMAGSGTCKDVCTELQMPDLTAAATHFSKGSHMMNNEQNRDRERLACLQCPTGALSEIDSHSGDQFTSRTLKCGTCSECYLHVHRGKDSWLIHLRDFLARRGGAAEQRPLDDRAMAEHLFRACVNDEFPSAAACVDFGLNSPMKYAAMQYAVKEGIGPYELDRVHGDGKAITELVAFATARYRQLRNVQFTTPYDESDTTTEEAQNQSRRKQLRTKTTLEL
jgi:hypothetical protein